MRPFIEWILLPIRNKEAGCPTRARMGLKQMMDRRELKAYLDAQVHEIHRYQREQSRLRARSITLEQAANEWIEQFSARFRQDWERARDSQAY